MMIIAVAEALGDGDTSGLVAARRVASQWLPLRLYSALFTKGLDPEEVLRSLTLLLAVGVSQMESHDENEQKVKKKARRSSWEEVIATYAAVYSTTPYKVLDEPWAFFVSMMVQTDRIIARSQHRQAEWYAAVKTGKMDSIIERAGYKQTIEDLLPEGVSPKWKDPQWVQEQINKTKKIYAKA